MIRCGLLNGTTMVFDYPFESVASQDFSSLIYAVTATGHYEEIFQSNNQCELDFVEPETTVALYKSLGYFFFRMFGFHGTARELQQR